MILLRVSTGSLCSVAHDQILFVQWCLWATTSSLWTSRSNPESRVSRLRGEGKELRHDESLGLPW
uniref:Uncharacterized protein n=1 Tax=Hyaloperonospora arabidopsidis (strain Emoy2) TaxID=559515 RepID=M4BG75_HYAAE